MGKKNIYKKIVFYASTTGIVISLNGCPLENTKKTGYTNDNNEEKNIINIELSSTTKQYPAIKRTKKIRETNENETNENETNKIDIITVNEEEIKNLDIFEKFINSIGPINEDGDYFENIKKFLYDILKILKCQDKNDENNIFNNIFNLILKVGMEEDNIILKKGNDTDIKKKMREINIILTKVLFDKIISIKNLSFVDKSKKEKILNCFEKDFEGLNNREQIQIILTFVIIYTKIDWNKTIKEISKDISYSNIKKIINTEIEKINGKLAKIKGKQKVDFSNFQINTKKANVKKNIDGFLKGFILRVLIDFVIKHCELCSKKLGNMFLINNEIKEVKINLSYNFEEKNEDKEITKIFEKYNKKYKNVCHMTFEEINYEKEYLNQLLDFNEAFKIGFSNYYVENSSKNIEMKYYKDFYNYCDCKKNNQNTKKHIENLMDFFKVKAYKKKKENEYDDLGKNFGEYLSNTEIFNEGNIAINYDYKNNKDYLLKFSFEDDFEDL